MAFSVTCPGCRSVYPVAETLAGKTIRCKKCGELIKVAAPPAATPVAKAVPARRPAAADDDAPVRKPARRPADDEYDDDMDDAPRRAKGKGGQPAKKGGPPVALLAGVGAVLLLGGAAAGYVAFSGGDDKKPTPVADAAPAEAARPAASAVQAGASDAATKADPDVTLAKPVEKTAEKPADKPKAGDAEKPAEAVKPTPVAEAAAPPAGATPQDRPTSLTMSYDQYMSGVMNRLTSDRVKRSTLLIQVEMTNGGKSRGTGWFGVEPGLVFTNSHVLNMLAPNSKRPAKITFYLNSGTPEQREIADARIKLLAVDRDMDLALLQVVNEEKLPPPLEVKPSATLTDGQGLNTIGFPESFKLRRLFGGSAKEPEVSVRRTTFAAFQRDDFQQIRRVQYDGASNHGNSGGPVVDAEGTVRSVAVEGFFGSGAPISFGVPTEYVYGLLSGRIADVEYGVAYKDGGKVKIPVTANCLDPLNRLQKVGIAAWVGYPKDKPRLPGPTRPTPASTDTGATEIELKYDKEKKVAAGELVLPALQAGQAYWVQPHFVHPLQGDMRTYYMPGIKVPMTGPPVDRTPTDLVVKLRPGTARSVSMSNSGRLLTEEEEGEGDGNRSRIDVETKMEVNEAVFQPDQRDQLQAARLRLQFKKIEPKIKVGGGVREFEFPKDLLNRLNQLINQAEAVGLVNRAGEMYKYQINALALRNPTEQLIVRELGGDALEALQVTSIPLPNRRVSPGETWKSSKDMRLTLFTNVVTPGPPQGGGGGPGGRPQTQVKTREYRYKDEMTFTYIGQRERQGKKEAVVKIEGKAIQAPGSRETVHGSVKGYALVELETGIVVEADIDKEYELDTSSEGMRKTVSGGNHYKLTRGSAN